MKASWQAPPSGAMAVAVSLVGLLALVILTGLGLARCSPAPRPGPIVSPSPHASTIASSSSSSGVLTRVVLRPSSTHQEAAQGARETGAGPNTHGTPHNPPKTGAGEAEEQPWEIVVETMASSSAASTSSAQVAGGVDNHGDNHARLGITIGTMPGVVGVSFMLGSVHVPRELAGLDLELGVDLVGNLEAAGVAATAGGKAYAAAGAWSTWRLDRQGVLLGVGLRF